MDTEATPDLELAPGDEHATNTDDMPIEAVDGIQDVPQEPISEDDAALMVEAS